MVRTEQIRGALRAYLKAQHLSPSAYADKKNFTHQTVIRWANSDAAVMIRPSNYAKIAKDIEPYLREAACPSAPAFGKVCAAPACPLPGPLVPDADSTLHRRPGGPVPGRLSAAESCKSMINNEI